jgi:hypothetical protein
MWTCSNRIARRASLLERRSLWTFGLAVGLPFSVRLWMTADFVVNESLIRQGNALRGSGLAIQVDRSVDADDSEALDIAGRRPVTAD